MASLSIEQLSVGQDARGHNIDVDVYRFKGSNPDAPKAYLQAGVHGDELQGSLVLHLLKNKLMGPSTELRDPVFAVIGDIVLIPSCNPMAQNNLNGYHIQGRCDSIEGDNWNRFYYFDEADLAAFNGQNNAELKTYLSEKIEAILDQPEQLTRARNLNLTLQKEAFKADIVMDLHTDCVSAPYVYAPAYCKIEAAQFQLPYVLLMENGFGGAMDEAMMCPFWTVSERVAGVQPIQSYTLECGSAQSLDEASASALSDNILNYLVGQGVISGQVVPCDHHPHYCNVNDFVKLYAPQGGLYVWQVALNDTVAEGDVLAVCHQHDATLEVKAPFNMKIVNLFSPQALPQGAPMMKVCRL